MAISQGLSTSVPTDDKAFGDYLNLFLSIDTAANLMAQSEVAFALGRIQLHSLMGTLLDQIHAPVPEPSPSALK